MKNDRVYMAVSLSREQKATINKSAQEAGLSSSNFVRKCLGLPLLAHRNSVDVVTENVLSKLGVLQKFKATKIDTNNLSYYSKMRVNKAIRNYGSRVGVKLYVEKFADHVEVFRAR